MSRFGKVLNIVLSFAKIICLGIRILFKSWKNYK